ncbi:MAG: FAD-binding protein [Caldilineaceae bacterium]|nr:FAD-binding protein [Caldilineaceae bacterium]
MLTQTQLQPLTQLFAKRQLATDTVSLITYEIDAGFDRGKPDAVFYPESTHDVSQIMGWASSQRVPLIARGAGTGLSGGAVAEHGGIIVEFARMNRILTLDVPSRSAVVEPGLVNLVLDGEVKRRGLYFPPDPSSQRSSVLGGNIGENSGGPHCFKYGVTTNYVQGLEVVLADGTVVQLGGPALDYPEYDFCGVMVGSEGTLGIVTKAYVRMLRNPPGVKTLMIAFDSLEQAGRAVSAVIAAGLVPATLEMMDKKIMRMIEDYAGAGLPVEAEAGLIVEVDGYPASLDSQMEEVADLLTAHGGHTLRIAQSEEERQKIWYGRKSAAGAMSRLAPSFYLVDVTVPRSHLADMLTEVNEICDRHALTAGHVFHAGDGNLHPIILCDARNPALMERVFIACDEIIARCVAYQGSITGEHGVGIEKRRYMPAMYSGAELAAMLDLKALFDPHTLLNPGKVFPDTLPTPAYATPLLPTEKLFAPANAEEAAAGLVACAARGDQVRIRSQVVADDGGGVLLSTAKMNGVQRFAPDDLYVTVGAGTPLTALQAFLDEHQLQTALVSPWPQATIGGLIAANINAPQRMRYGGMRDNLLSTKVALTDGRVMETGRVVVKNVAGYDLTKLMVGSQGTLGMISTATLKLMPKPRVQRTVAIPVTDLQQGIAWGQALLPTLLVASGLVLCPGKFMAKAWPTPYALVITAEGTREDVESELSEIDTRFRASNGQGHWQESTATSTDLWAAFVGGVAPEQLLARSGIPLQQVGNYWKQVASLGPTQWCLDLAHGLAYAAHTPADGAQAQQWLTALRQPSLALGGYSVLMHTPTALHSQLDANGYQPTSRTLMHQLKARWDPKGILPVMV